MRFTGMLFRLVVLALVLATSAANIQAQETTNTFLSDLHRFRISNYLALDAYYRFSGTSDPEILSEINAGINAANDAMNRLTRSKGQVLTEAQLEALSGEFGKFRILMRDNINDIRTLGYPDLRLVSDMANQALSMNTMATELYTEAQKSSHTRTTPRLEAARMGAVKLAQMMTKYAARSNSNVVQVFQGADTETPLDKQAAEFDTLLGQMSKGPAEGELRALLQDVNSKWLFIRGSYINYNENNVSFVIDRYSKSILRSLDRIIALLQASGQ